MRGLFSCVRKRPSKMLKSRNFAVRSFPASRERDRSNEIDLGPSHVRSSVVALISRVGHLYRSLGIYSPSLPSPKGSANIGARQDLGGACSCVVFQQIGRASCRERV